MIKVIAACLRPNTNCGMYNRADMVNQLRSLSHTWLHAWVHSWTHSFAAESWPPSWPFRLLRGPLALCFPRSTFERGRDRWIHAIPKQGRHQWTHHARRHAVLRAFMSTQNVFSVFESLSWQNHPTVCSQLRSCAVGPLDQTCNNHHRSNMPRLLAHELKPRNRCSKSARAS